MTIRMAILTRQKQEVQRIKRPQVGGNGNG